MLKLATKLTPMEFKGIRLRMGFTQLEMAEWLYLPSGSRVIRAWEAGKYKIPGSVKKCFELAGEI
jgi:DNA-binding transcriptional regulator YiaG